ncbi:MAG: histidine phosphatase family protein [Gammaproteobacteria bacterium]|nr:histidine phosphatase family protein [Gammaproteobacteria bacterium]
MVKFYITRHGQDVDNKNGILNGRRDQPLTELGQQQATSLAEHIDQSKIEFCAVYSSPLQRTMQTAHTITTAVAAPEPVVLEGLIERDFGEMTGLEVGSIDRLCAPDVLKTATVTYFLSPPGAETFPDLMDRAGQLLSQLQNWHQDGNVLLVTHGDFGKMLYAQYYNQLWQEVLAGFHFGNSELLVLADDHTPEQAHVFKVEQSNH